jgi:hypothetical protein
MNFVMNNFWPDCNFCRVGQNSQTTLEFKVVNSPKNLNSCLFSLKEIEQNKGSNSSSRTASEEKNDRNKHEKKSRIHLDTQLHQLVNQFHSLNVGDDDHYKVSRIRFHIDG